MVIQLNNDKIKKKEKELIHFNGFIPMDFNYLINMKQRNNFLKSIGKFDEVQQEQIKIRYNAKTADDTDEYLEQVLIKWIEKNPQFRNCVIF